MKFTVTEKAMRPASPDRACFYCGQPIGEEHIDTCVLVRKLVKIRATIEFEARVPAHWDKGDIEFHRNESSSCKDNFVRDLEEYVEHLGQDGYCLCCNDNNKFEYLCDVSGPFLGED